VVYGQRNDAVSLGGRSVSTRGFAVEAGQSGSGWVQGGEDPREWNQWRRPTGDEPRNHRGAQPRTEGQL